MSAGISFAMIFKSYGLHIVFLNYCLRLLYKFDFGGPAKILPTLANLWRTICQQIWSPAWSLWCKYCSFKFIPAGDSKFHHRHWGSAIIVKPQFLNNAQGSCCSVGIHVFCHFDFLMDNLIIIFPIFNDSLLFKSSPISSDVYLQ